MRILGTILLTLIVTLGFSQVDPEQIYQAPGRDYVLLSTDTLNSSYPINGIYVPTRLKDSIFFKSDSICISIFDDGRPEKCLLMPEGGGGSSDTLSYWIFQVNGGVDDTIYQAERINLVAGTRITITGGTDNPTINADSCLQRLEQLTDSTFRMTDCAGNPLDTILIPIPAGGGGGVEPDSLGTIGNAEEIVYRKDNSRGAASSPNFTYDSSRVAMRINNPSDTSSIRISTQSTEPTALYLQHANDEWRIQNGRVTGFLDISNLTEGNSLFNMEPDGDWTSGTSMRWDRNNLHFGIGTLNPGHNVHIDGGVSSDFTMEYDNLPGSTGHFYFRDQTGQKWGIGSVSSLDGNVFRIHQYFNKSFSNIDSTFFAITDTGFVGINKGDTATANLNVFGSVRFEGLPQLTPDSVIVADADEYLSKASVYDLIDTSGWGVDIDTDSQSLSIVDHTLSISRGNSVVLPDTVAPSQIISIDGDTITLSDGGGSVVIQHPPSSDTVKLKPFHEVWTNSDSTLTVNAGWDTLVSYNDSIRWKLLDNRIDAIAMGKGARSDHYNSTALGARAFPYLQDTLIHPFNSTQVDTANEWIDGLGSFITHLNDLGYQTGDIVVIKWSLTSGEMPFIDTAQDLRVAEGIHAFTITSPSLLSPVQFGFDSVPTGFYTLQANQYLTGSTAIGHDAVVDKANQIVLGDSTSQELKLGDSIRMKIDTAYTHFQLVGFDSTYNQLIPIDAAAFGFTPDADFWELEVDASPGSITDNTYTLGQTVFAADTSVNSYYVQVVPPNGDGINVRDPFGDDVDVMWSGATYSWAWRLENDAFFLQDAGDPGVGTGVYINAISGYDDPDPILELQVDGGMQWSNYGIGSPRDGGSDFYAIPFVDGGGGVYQLRPDDFLDSLDLSNVGDSTGVIIPDREIAFGDGTRGLQSNSNLFLNANDVVVETPRAIQTGNGATDGQASFITIGGRRAGNGSAYLDWHSTTGTYGTRAIRNSGTNGSFSFTHSGTGGIVFRNVDAADIEFETNSTDRLNILSTGEVGINQSSPSAQLHVDGTVRLDNLAADGVSGVLYYDAENDIGRRSLANLLTDIGGPFDNYDGFDLYTAGGFRERINSGQNLDIRGSTGLGVSWASQGIVTLSNDFQFQIYVDGGVQADVQYNNDIGFVDGTGIDAVWVGGANNNIRFDAADASATNELQNLSYTAATRVMAISSGTNATIPLFTSTAPGLVNSSGGGTDNFLRADGTWAAPPGGGGGGGIYDGSDNLTAGTTTATILSGSVFNFQYNTGDSEFTISGTGTFLRSNPSGASNAVELDAGGVSIEAASGDQIDFNVAGGTNEIVIDGSNVYVNDGMLIGGATDDQIRIGGTSGQYAYVGHEDAGGISGNGIRFYDNGTNNMEIEIDGETYIGDTNTERLKIHNTSTTVLMGHETGDDSAIRFYANGNLAFAVPGNTIQMLGSYVYTDDTELGVGDVPNTVAGYELDVDGDINYSGSLTNVSDSTIKQDITYLTNPYDKVLALKPAMFHYKDGLEETESLNKERWHYNYIAQDYQQVFPDQITMDYDIMAIQKGAAEMYTVAAVQQLIKEVQQLKSEIKTLKSRK